MDDLDTAPDWDEAPEDTARRAGLRYVRDDAPGLTRKRWGRGFTYLDRAGEHVTDADRRARLDALAIPPAWTDVWICPDPKGHLLATGRDDAGRKQYLYHPDWERARSEVKFFRLHPFGLALPEVRDRYRADLRQRGLPRTRVLAVVTALLDRTRLRVGNDEYAARNRSYGLTTLRDRHVDFHDAGCTFTFVGKRGQEQRVTLEDPRLAALVRACRDVPGYDLFQYHDDAGRRGTVTSDDVNTYLRETTGQPFSAKDFRTWGGTLLAADALGTTAAPDAEADAAAAVRAAVDAVAEHLGNTPAVCRDYYVHPAVPAAFAAGTLQPAWRRGLRRKTPRGLEPEERALVAFLDTLAP